MTRFVRVTQQLDEFTEDFQGLAPRDPSKLHCFAKHGLLESTSPVPRHERLHISLVCGPDSSGFDKDAHMAVLTLHQAENCHPAGRMPAILT